MEATISYDSGAVVSTSRIKESDRNTLVKRSQHNKSKQKLIIVLL